jgi:hypothetical protein
LHDGRRRRQIGRSHEVLIDFAGSKLVANFGTLNATGLSKAVTMIKRRMWDLKVERDREPPVNKRQHEMILHRPRSDDPQVSPRQLANINEELEGLIEQADQEELRLRPMYTVDAIGDHVLNAEAA